MYNFENVRLKWATPPIYFLIYPHLTLLHKILSVVGEHYWFNINAKWQTCTILLESLKQFPMIIETKKCLFILSQSTSFILMDTWKRTQQFYIKHIFDIEKIASKTNFLLEYFQRYGMGDTLTTIFPERYKYTRKRKKYIEV